MGTELMRLIEGVSVRPLTYVSDLRGCVLRMLRSDSPLFTGFGELYFSYIEPGQVKAWKMHEKITQRLVVPLGKVRFVLHDNRTDSQSFGKTELVDMGFPEPYSMLLLSPGIWYGFFNLSPQASLIANCTDLPYDESEVHRLPLDSVAMPTALLS